MSIEFTQGEFQKLRTTNKIHLGAFQVDLPKGIVVEFDGETLKWGGKTYNVPQLSAGANAGWLVKVADTTSKYVPKPAGVRVRPAQSAGNKRGDVMPMEEATEEEMVVDTLGNAKKRRDAARDLANKQDGAETPGQNDDASVVDDSEISFDDDDSFTPEIVSADAPEQEAVSVATIQSSAKGDKMIVDSPEAASKAIRQFDNSRIKVKKTTTSRVSDDLEGLLPGTASSGVPESSVLLSDGTRWSMNDHWRTRVSKITDYANDLDVVRQIISLEGEKVAKHMRKALAKKGVDL